LRSERPVHWELRRSAEDGDALLLDGELEAHGTMRSEEIQDRVAVREVVD
jgi:hypothetical protein